ncbi:unannotated protein [freshwater metagenome]|uniref:Unannotated protein n=1 Tax=freshwater metagenome TaxID=449393 RepID=A0A6J6NVG8_9ZZZZ
MVAEADVAVDLLALLLTVAALLVSVGAMAWLDGA